MILYNHLNPNQARIIIDYANNGMTKYRISKLTGINKNKIIRCLNIAISKGERKQNLQKSWREVKIKIRNFFIMKKVECRKF